MVQFNKPVAHSQACTGNEASNQLLTEALPSVSAINTQGFNTFKLLHHSK